MGQVLWLTIPLIALAMAVYMAYWLMTKITQFIEANKKISPHGVVKRDWFPTGRVDFTTRLNGADDQNKEQPGEFKLLVEEWRMVESLTGNENLEIQWRLATLSEAKTVISQYNKYLSENSLIKSLPELSLPAPHSVSSPPTNGKENTAEAEIPRQRGAAPSVVHRA